MEAAEKALNDSFNDQILDKSQKVAKSKVMVSNSDIAASQNEKRVNSRRNRSDRAKSGMLPVSKRMMMRKINNKEIPKTSPVKRPVAPTPISMSLLRVRRPKQSDITFQPRRHVEIDEDEMVVVGRDNRVYATSQISNDAWFDKLALDKSIA